MPSATSADAVAFVSVASPPPVSSVAAITSYVQTSMNQWMQLLATIQQDIGNAFNALGQEIAQEASSVQQQWDNLLGINPTPPNPSPNITAPQPSSDSGAGRGNAGGSGSGSGTLTTANNAPNQTLNSSTPQSGSGSGSGSSTTTNQASTGPSSMKAQPLDSPGSGSLFNGSGSGTGSIGSGTGSGPATISGNVWLDNNGDGIINNGEQGYEGITVGLVTDPSTGYIARTTTTDYYGNFGFGIPEGSEAHSYAIAVILSSAPYMEATIPGVGQGEYSSQIGPQGYTMPFLLQNGGWRFIEAGIRSMNVTTTQDDANGPIKQQVTLRDAIQTGNNSGGKAVTFLNPQNGQPLNGAITLQAALDSIKKSYDVNGPGASALAVNGNNKAGTIFTVNAGVTSTINNLTVEGGSGANGGGVLNNGDLTLLQDYINDNQTTGAGGGVNNAAGASLWLSADTVNGNGAQRAGGGLENFGSVQICCGTTINGNSAFLGGGGIDNQNGGTITASDSTQINGNSDPLTGGGVANFGTFIMHGGSISNNFEQGPGGGVYNNAGKLSLDSGATIQNNQALGGGGIYVNSGNLTLTGGVTITSNNRAQLGGGLIVRGGTVNMSGGSIANNKALGTNGGGILIIGGSLTLTKVNTFANTAQQSGGGMFVLGGTVKVKGGTIEGNSASANGGGIYVNAGSLTLSNSVTITVNDATNGAGMYVNGGTVSMAGGMLGYNTAAGGNGGGIYNKGGTLTLRLGVTIGPENAATQGGGMYLANGSNTRINACTVSGNVAKTGVGVYQQNNANVNAAPPPGGLTDNDDPDGQPVKGP